jgi:hypothetical protein
LKTIIDFDPNLMNKDSVRFSNLRSTDLSSVRRQGAHLELTFSTRDQLVITNHFVSPGYEIEVFGFSNGVTLTAADVLALIPPP